MSKSSFKLRLVLLGLLLVTAVAGLAAARWAALPWALGAALKAGGATEVSFDVTTVSPWRVEVDDLAFRLDTLRFAAERTSFERAHWWSPSLGRLRVETARLDVDLSRPAATPTTAASGGKTVSSPKLPFAEISFDGRIALHAGDISAPALAVTFAARPDQEGNWQGEAKASAPGLDLTVEADYASATQAVDFRTQSLHVEILPWQTWLEHWAPLPSGPWELTGKVTGAVTGSYREGKLSGAGDFHLREGRAANPGQALVAEGIEADIAHVDLAQLLARDIAVRARSFTAGKVVMTDLQAGLTSATAERIEVASLSLQALGGKLHVEPFSHRLADPGVEAVVRAEAIRAEQVLALTQDLPAQATGPLSGRLPLRYEAGALKLGTGWLGLAAGSSLEIKFHAEGLLTAGVPPKSANYAVLKQIEDGLLNLKVTELRLDVRPPNAPGNRTAQLRIMGEPVDPRVKAPVTLDLNVNGPIESLLNLGLKGGVSVGTKP